MLLNLKVSNLWKYLKICQIYFSTTTLLLTDGSIVVKKKIDDRENISSDIPGMPSIHIEDTDVSAVFMSAVPSYRLLLPLHSSNDIYGFIGVWRARGWSCILLAHLLDQINTSLCDQFKKTSLVSKIARRDHNYGKGKEFHMLKKYITRRPRFWWKKVPLKNGWKMGDVCESYRKFAKPSNA